MHISEIFAKNKTTLSFEFFPPRTSNSSQRLFTTINNLTPLHPSFVSVTYGAGGSTRELTHDLVVRIQQEVGLTVVAHLTCVQATEGELSSILQKYHVNGISNIMALRGDPPKSNPVGTQKPQSFNDAEELVRFIRRDFPGMGIGVAGYVEGHPQARNRLAEMDYLKRKVDAGANYICTQLFFDNRDFYDFRERCLLAGIHVPIIAGIMPITSTTNIQTMADFAPCARFPAPLLKSIARANQPDLVENVGIHWAAEQVRDLLDNEVNGIHFYTLNKWEQIKKICDSIGITSATQLR